MDNPKHSSGMTSSIAGKRIFAFLFSLMMISTVFVIVCDDDSLGEVATASSPENDITDPYEISDTGITSPKNPDPSVAFETTESGNPKLTLNGSKFAIHNSIPIKYTGYETLEIAVVGTVSIGLTVDQSVGSSCSAIYSEYGKIKICGDGPASSRLEVEVGGVGSTYYSYSDIFAIFSLEIADCNLVINDHVDNTYSNQFYVNCLDTRGDMTITNSVVSITKDSLTNTSQVAVIIGIYSSGHLTTGSNSDVTVSVGDAVSDVIAVSVEPEMISISGTQLHIKAGENTKGSAFSRTVPQSALDVHEGWTLFGSTELDAEPTAIEGDVTEDYCIVDLTGADLPPVIDITPLLLAIFCFGIGIPLFLTALYMLSNRRYGVF